MSIHKELHILKTDDHGEFALWRISKRNNSLIKKEAIFLSHGAFSDKNVCIGIADYLANHGYICFILEWRGHGTSQKQIYHLILKLLHYMNIKLHLIIFTIILI